MHGGGPTRSAIRRKTILVECDIRGMRRESAALKLRDLLRKMPLNDSRIAEAPEVEYPVGQDRITQLISAQQVKNGAFIENPLMTDILPANFRFRITACGEGKTGLHIPCIPINEARRRGWILLNKFSNALETPWQQPIARAQKQQETALGETDALIHGIVNPLIFFGEPVQ